MAHHQAGNFALRTLLLTLPVVFSLGAFMAACGSSDSSSPSTPAAGGAGQGGAAGAGDAGEGGDGQAGDAGAGGDAQGGAGGDAQGGAAGAGVDKAFQVTLQSIYGFNGNKPKDYYNVGFAYALIATPLGELMKCTTESVDGCTLAVCQTGATGSGGETPVKASAGDITITGAAVSPIALTQGANGFYLNTTALATDKPLFKGGETLVAKATGGTMAPGVKGFEIQTTAPTPAKVDGIAVSDDPTKAIGIDTSAALTLTSDDKSGDTLQFVITAGMQGGTSAASLICAKPLDGTPLKISSATLQKLKNVSPTALRYISQTHRQVTQVQDLALRLVAETNVTDKTGAPVAGLALLTLN
jgi:hypothetical protein